jgi:hypothetical protein
LYAPQEKSRAIDFCAVLKRQPPDTIASFPVVLKYAETSKTKDKRELCGSLHVYRMPAKAAQAARKRVSRQHQRKQKKLSTKTLFLRQFVLVFTSLSSGQLAGEAVLALYRGRWQIELAIKRLKSLSNMTKLRAERGSKLAEVSLYGKMLYVLLVEHKMRTTFGHAWGALDRERSGAWWRLYKL